MVNFVNLTRNATCFLCIVGVIESNYLSIWLYMENIHIGSLLSYLMLNTYQKKLLCVARQAKKLPLVFKTNLLIFQDSNPPKRGRGRPKGSIKKTVSIFRLYLFYW